MILRNVRLSSGVLLLALLALLLAVVPTSGAAPAGGRFLYVQQDAGGAAPRLVLADGAGRTLRVLVRDGFRGTGAHTATGVEFPALSPNGRYAAYQIQPMAVCPPGTARVVCDALENKRGPRGLRIFDLQTGSVAAVRHGSVAIWEPQMRWASDSSAVYVEGYEEAGCPIVTAVPTGPDAGPPPPPTTPANTDGSGHVNMALCYTALFTISPDGTHVRTLSKLAAGPAVPAQHGGRIAVLATPNRIGILDATRRHVTTAVSVPKGHFVESFDWAPDGRFVLCLTQITKGAAPNRPDGLWITDSTGKHLHRLLPGAWHSVRFLDNDSLAAVLAPQAITAAWASDAQPYRLQLAGGRIVARQLVLPRGSSELDYAPASSN